MTIGWMARAREGSITVMILLAIGAGPVVARADAWDASSNLIPATHLSGAECVVSGTSAIPSHPGTTPPTVSSHPSGVEIVWLPGLYGMACQAVLTRGNAHIASDLGSDIDHAPVVVARGPISCNVQDDRTSVRLYFTYARRSTQRIDDYLSECGSITDSGGGGTSRSPTNQFLRDMTTLAPAAWRVYVAPYPDPTS
jgi:hypothetical protein